MQVKNISFTPRSANPKSDANNISQNDKPKNSHLFDFSQIAALLFEDEPELQLLSFNLELQGNETEEETSNSKQNNSNQFESTDLCLFSLENIYLANLEKTQHNAEAEQASEQNTNINLPAEAKVDLDLFNFSLFSENKSVKIPQKVQNLANNIQVFEEEKSFEQKAIDFKGLDKNISSELRNFDISSKNEESQNPTHSQKEKQNPLKSIENPPSAKNSKLNIIVQSEEEIPEMEFKIPQKKIKEPQTISFQNENILSNKYIQSESPKHNNSQLQLLLSLKSNSYFPKESESRTQNISPKIENFIPSDIKINIEASTEEETVLMPEKKNFIRDHKTIKPVSFVVSDKTEEKPIKIENKKESQVPKQNEKIEFNKSDNTEKEVQKEIKPEISNPKKEEKNPLEKVELKQNETIKIEHKNIKPVSFVVSGKTEEKPIKIENKKESQVLKQIDKIELNKSDNIEKEVQKEIKPDISNPKKEEKKPLAKVELKQNESVKIDHKNTKPVHFATIENVEEKQVKIENKKESQVPKQNEKVEFNKSDNTEKEVQKEIKPDISNPKKEEKAPLAKVELKQNDYLAEKRIINNINQSGAARTEVEENNNNAQNKMQLNKNSQEAQTPNFGNVLNKTQNLAKNLNALNTNKTFEQGISQYTSRIYPNEFVRTTFNLISSLPENSSGTANLILKPASLGTIIVNINLKDKVLNVDIKPENKDVAKIIESQLPQLKERLASVGVQFDSINLNEDQAEKDLTEKKQSKKEDKEKQKELKTQQNFISSLVKEEKEIESPI